MARGGLDPGYPRNPKVRQLTPAALALDIAGICYANAKHTDGHVAEEDLPSLFRGVKQPRRALGELLAVGRWHAAGHDCDRCPDPVHGWHVHDFADWNITSEGRRVTRDRKQRSRGRHADVTRDMPVTDAGQDADPSSLPPTPPNPSSTASSKRVTKARAKQRPADFEPGDTHRRYADEHGLDLAFELELFANHHDSKGNTFVDWSKALSTWLGNAVSYGRGKKHDRNGNVRPMRASGADWDEAARRLEAEGM